jgi:putative nucleotidyltransferase with HDIG domain
VIGSLVGGYRVVTELGTGVLGTVYYAEHPVIGRRAAIKVLSQEVSRGAARLERFLTHLKVVGSIRHPNIVDVLDVGQTPTGATFIVMEMLEGESLDERLERVGMLDEITAVRVLAQIASAVGAAHDRSLIHGALKAGNVFITNNVDYPDFVKVLDFGALTLTATAAQKPSPYWAPELRVGNPPDSESDVFAIGVLAYEMLVGARPFASHGALAPAQVARELDGSRPGDPLPVSPPQPAPSGDGEAWQPGAPSPPMPVHQRNPGISPALSRVVDRALAIDPEQRWSSLREFRRAIERALTAPSAPEAELERVGGQGGSGSGSGSGSAGGGAGRATEPPATASSFLSSADEVRVERLQARKVGRALSDIVVRRMQENRLQVPTMPLVALKALDVLRDPSATFATIAKVIEQDPVIAARILRVVNSAAYSRRQTVTTIEQAVSQIGVKPLRILLVELAACQIFTSRSAGIRQKFKLIWEHCLAVGMLARDLAELVSSRVEPDVAYLGGLLHDLGKPIVAGLLLEAERKLVEELDVPWMTETLWQKTVAEAHRGVGAALASGWRLPSAVVEAIEHCDSYDRAAGPHACANLVRFANVLAKREGIYVGDVSGEEIVATVLQGRQVLRVDERAEAQLVATLRDRTSHVVGERGARAVNPNPRSPAVHQPPPSRQPATHHVPVGVRRTRHA